MIRELMVYMIERLYAVQKLHPDKDIRLRDVTFDFSKMGNDRYGFVKKYPKIDSRDICRAVVRCCDHKFMKNVNGKYMITTDGFYRHKIYLDEPE